MAKSKVTRTNAATVAAKECVGFSIRRAARAIGQVYDGHLAACDLKGTQFSLLNAIALSDKPTIKQLAEILLMDRTTLTRNLKPLEQQNLIKIVADSKDRRAKGLVLTGQGLARLKQALPLWAKAQAKVVKTLGATRLKRLRQDLKQLEILREHE